MNPTSYQTALSRGDMEMTGIEPVSKHAGKPARYSLVILARLSSGFYYSLPDMNWEDFSHELVVVKD